MMSINSDSEALIHKLETLSTNPEDDLPESVKKNDLIRRRAAERHHEHKDIEKLFNYLDIE